MVSPELQAQVAAFLQRRLSIESLEDWLVPRLARLTQDPESDDADLVAAIELGLAEMSAGIRDEDEFRALVECVHSTLSRSRSSSAA